MDNWSTICIRQDQEIVQRCLENPEAFVSAIVKFGSVRSTILFRYTEAITRKEILPIEAAPEEVKQYFWAEAKKDAAGRLTLHPLKQLAKVLYYMDHLLNQYS